MEERVGKLKEMANKVVTLMRGMAALKEDLQAELGEDAILKNQEILQIILTNQDTMKGLVGELQNSVSTIEERIQAMEQEMSILAQFTQELNQVGDEANWS